MSFGPDDSKQRIKAAIDIVDLVGDYLQLRREGRGYKAICPWHDDTRPSLQVNQERQSFKCWVCDIGGDIFDFVMRQEGVEFREALRMLADRAGITLAARQPGSPNADAVDQKRTLYQAMAWAEKQYHACLIESPEAAPARAYLTDRGLSEDTIGRFHLGFAPESWDWLLKRAGQTPFNPQILERVGLVARRQNGPGYYDRFRGRVLFPIRDSQDRPVGLGGRILPGAAATEAAKYINSPETAIFSKSNLLYGLDAARHSLAKSRAAIVMEGYTDCLIAQQFGFHDAVAVLGTALGERHVKLLRRYADRIILVLDGDAAGQRRANEVLELFIAENVDLRVLSLPAGLDPCEFLLEAGPDKFRELLENPADALTHAFRAFTSGVDPDNVHAMSQSLDKLLAIVAQAPRLRADTTTESRLREQKALERLAFMFRIPEVSIRARLTELRRKRKTKAPDPGAGAAEEAATRIDPWEKQLLEILIERPDLLENVLDCLSPEDLASPSCRTILEKSRALHQSGLTPGFEQLLLEFEDPRIKNLLVECDEDARAKGLSDLPAQLEHLLTGFRRRREDRQRKVDSASLRQPAGDEIEQQRLLERILEQQRNRQGISVPTDG